MNETNKKILHNTIGDHLESLHLMGVGDAFNCIMDTLRQFVEECREKVDREKLNLWVEGLDEQTQNNFEHYRNTANPYNFLFWKFIGEVSKTITNSEYERYSENIQSQKRPAIKSVDKFRNQLVKYAMQRPFNEGLAYLGELAGAWVLTCPECQIRDDDKFRNLIKEYREGTIGLPYSEYIRESSGKVSLQSDNDIELLFALDYMIYEYIDLMTH